MNKCGSCRSGNNTCGSTLTGCAMTLDAACVIYQGGTNLDQIGGLTTMRLEQILININTRLRSLAEQIQDGFIGVNVGGGIELYKGLNEDGVGELRTFRSTDSIVFSNDTNTISAAVRQSFIDSILDPINNDISGLESRIAQLETALVALTTRVTQAEDKITTLETQYVDLYEKYNLQQTQLNNIQDNINILDTRLTQTIDRLTTAEDTIANHGQRILALEQLITEISTAGGILVSEQFTGQQIMQLSRSASRIVGVYHNGLRLSTAWWTFEYPNLVALQMLPVEITVEPTDYITVDYMYTPINILDTLDMVKNFMEEALENQK